MNNIFIVIGLCASIAIRAGQPVFTDEIVLPATDIKMQSKTNTCWVFSTISFLETELIRLQQDTFDFSEMFLVHHAYRYKAKKYVLSHGKSRLSDGGLARDIFYLIENEGIMPEKYYAANKRNGLYFHDPLKKALKDYLDPWTLKGRYKKRWQEKVNKIIEEDLPKPSSKFETDQFNGSALSYSNTLKLNFDDYIEFTSFSHQPYYQEFVLEVPDNWLDLPYKNIPIDKFCAIVDTALARGYTLAWAGDFSEHNFHGKKGYACVDDEDALSQLSVEDIQCVRQDQYETYKTTDDHSMHIIGMAKDENGNIYYKAKNSWGHYGTCDGYVYISQNYLKLKTIALLVHKNGVPVSVRNKF